MKRFLAAGIGLIATASFLMACSDDSSDSGNDTPAAVSTTVEGGSGGTEVSNGGDTEVTVDGTAVEGLDLGSVSCVKQGGKINVGSASVGGQQGLGIVMTDEATPKVESLGIVVDGNALAVTSTMGMSVGSAEVSADGDTYTITGEAEGANMSNPTEGMIKKEFTIKVTCS